MKKKTTKKETIEATVGDIVRIENQITAINQRIPFSLSLRLGELRNAIKPITDAFREEVEKIRKSQTDEDGKFKDGGIEAFNKEVESISKVKTTFEFVKFDVDEFKDKDGKELDVDTNFAYDMRCVIKNVY